VRANGEHNACNSDTRPTGNLGVGENRKRVDDTAARRRRACYR
jgi:hypothetical protein